MITPESPTSRTFQSLAEATNGIVTPANAVDAGAFGLAIHAAPRLDTWQGICEAIPAYGADLVDGEIARRTGTASDTGARVDAIGDKIKLAWAMGHMWHKNLADRDVLGVVVIQNVANTTATAYDRCRNETPMITEARKLGKRAMFGQAMGLGVQAVGTRVTRSGHERAGRAIKQAGRYLALGTAATFGVASTIDYIKTARKGTPKQRSTTEHPLAQVIDLGGGRWQTVERNQPKPPIYTNPTRRGAAGSL